MQDDIINDLCKMLKQHGYVLAIVNIQTEAYTDPVLPFVYFSKENGSIFALAEEYFHIENEHSGRLLWTDNDERNPHEHEAWNEALSWLKRYWNMNEGGDNYLKFMEYFGVPYSLETSVIEEFCPVNQNINHA
ncbi:hypothetical protein WOSG25_180170 [Weissella oryzae SG25]|uniref:Uncharacterized protein n=1 Tax=Weissella oryzae (strain DSM 25784 / JCM 18191 / LMG 30913 / SG25) TaxID=1329250 RepID=A0A069D3A8_WEIOS|nr:hypothetical protein [Weissella oryzae]GAK31866.1 hypothetical protein WOSG25_180170 [Weissella oryzae SG25]